MLGRSGFCIITLVSSCEHWQKVEVVPSVGVNLVHLDVVRWGVAAPAVRVYVCPRSLGEVVHFRTHVIGGLQSLLLESARLNFRVTGVVGALVRRAIKIYCNLAAGYVLIIIEAHELVLVRLPVVWALVIIIRIRICAAVVPQNAAGVPFRHPLVGAGSIECSAHHVAGAVSASVEI